MIKPKFILTTDAHLSMAMLNSSRVSVWLQDELLDYGGVIKEFTELSVTINDGKYLRATCEFRI